ncbi:MAG: excinuclease ABC subunit UvrA [Burkholderiales bacterium]|nr:excinuclease ABC subunit UvrA [Burkholderiales bacterium]
MSDPSSADPALPAYSAHSFQPGRPAPGPAATSLSVRGARTHNLKNIDLDLPKNALVVITGLSGSGKSSLAFDTLYAEGQRRYVESLSAYARQFLQLMDKPDVDTIDGLSPAIAIEQKATSHNPRSTVGTVTEIHDYLRLLYARAGTPHCPDHGLALDALSVGQMVDAVLAWPEGSRLLVLAPVARERKGEYAELFTRMQAQGYVRFRVDGVIVEATDLPGLKKAEKHDVDVVIDRLKVRPDVRQRLAESFEQALRIADGRAIALALDDEDDAGKPREHLFSSKFACPVCSYALAELESRLFSFNSPMGACPTCDGLGQVTRIDPQRVVAHPELGMADGAIKGWDRRNPYSFSAVESVARHYKFDVNTPFGQLSPAQQHVLLFGSGEQNIAFVYENEGDDGRKRSVKRSHPFEGIITSFERRLRETESVAVREELSRYQNARPCPDCAGARLRREARHVFLPHAGPLQGAASPHPAGAVGADTTAPPGSAVTSSPGQPIYAIAHASLGQARDYFDALQFSGAKAGIADKVVREIRARLGFLVDVGLSYLSLERGADTLSGGEAQRIRLASQIGSGLTGVMYVLDEPSIGLHQRDNERLIGTLRHLRDLGNTVIVVEHDEDMIRAADHVVDMGPGAGIHGGQVMAQGSPAEVAANEASLTGRYLGHHLGIHLPKARQAWRKPAGDKPTCLRIVNARGNNLRGVTAEIPIGLFTCVTGVSGSGKSTLVNDTLYAAVARHLYQSHDEPAPHDELTGLAAIDKAINVDQSPIGRTPRSNPATYTGLFAPIRELFAEVPAARERGYSSGRFSFNVSAANGGGRCEACQGDGVIKVEMHFLPDVYVVCDTCAGKRYNRETLDVLYKGHNISQVLDLTVEDAYKLFNAVPTIARKLQTLLDVGLGYVKLGQSATTLSGGEAQRVKLALELSKRDTGNTLYILDEPTTGLHFQDIEMLLRVLHQLRDAGNTVVVIEHNLDVIKTADWLIDMGPDGGSGGGRLLVAGTPETVAACEASVTGRFLKPMLGAQKKSRRPAAA